MPGRREAHAMAWIALAIGVTLCGVSVVLGFQGKTFMGRPLGGDFVEFYTIGKILNNYAPARVYDLRLAVGLQHAVLPTMAKTQMLVFAHAPFVASLFRPFAMLPYAWAYVAWLGFSAMLFVAGLALLFRTTGLTPQDRKTGFLLALSSTPFLFETWIGGQMSVVVFFIWVLFFRWLESDLRILAGFTLALCLFKPTLVALPVLMLLLGRRWRVFSGFVGGAVAMAILSLWTVGLEGCRAWLSALLLSRQIASGAGEAWHRAKYVDMAAFFHLLLGNTPVLTGFVLIATAMAAVVPLAHVWRRSDPSEPVSMESTLWAATLCFMLVINVYTPIYDAILMVTALALAARSPGGRQVLPIWLLALYLVSWVTQSFAEFLHLQLITVVLAGFGIWALGSARRDLQIAGKPIVRAFKPRQEESTMTGNLQPGATRRFQVRSRGLP
jgi:Glycosyltransferase family 87